MLTHFYTDTKLYSHSFLFSVLAFGMWEEVSISFVQNSGVSEN